MFQQSSFSIKYQSTIKWILVLIIAGMLIFLSQVDQINSSDQISASQEIGCEYHTEEKSIKLRPICLIRPSESLLNYRFTEIVESQRPTIEGFENAYLDDELTFNYSPSPAIIAAHNEQKIPQGPHRASYKSIYQTETITLDWKERELIAISFYSYFVTNRDISMYGNCSQRNYYVAAISIDQKIIQPEEEFDVNKRVAHRLGYCKTGEEDYMFYGGVCGAATQIFRIGLLHPDITIIEREPHQIRYNQYYGSILGGDDAGIAEQYKKLIIKNTSDYPIYFKYNDRIPDQLVEIVAITPTPYYHKLTTTITKEQLGPLEAQVTSFSKHPSHHYNSRTFHSLYKTVSTETVR